MSLAYPVRNRKCYYRCVRSCEWDSNIQTNRMTKLWNISWTFRKWLFIHLLFEFRFEWSHPITRTFPKLYSNFFHLTLVFYIFGSYLNPSCHTSDWLSKCYHRNWDRDMKILCSTFVLTRSTGRRKYHKVKWNENEPRNIGECRNWFVLIDVHCRHFCPNSHFDRIIILLK